MSFYKCVSISRVGCGMWWDVTLLGMGQRPRAESMAWGNPGSYWLRIFPFLEYVWKRLYSFLRTKDPLATLSNCSTTKTSPTHWVHNLVTDFSVVHHKLQALVRGCYFFPAQKGTRCSADRLSSRGGDFVHGLLSPVRFGVFNTSYAPEIKHRRAVMLGMSMSRQR